jgi:hypothetical protein
LRFGAARLLQRATTRTLERAMSLDIRRTPKTLLVLLGLLVLLWVSFFALQPTIRKLAGMLINLGLFYFVLCRNKWVTYVTAALLAVIAVEAFFAFFDTWTNIPALLNGMLSASACIYFLSPSMHRFLHQQ